MRHWFLVPALAVVSALALPACSEDDEGGASNSGGRSGASGAGGKAGAAGKGGAGGNGGAGANAGGGGALSGCGEAIFDASGVVNAAEYKRQATLWDRATIDCRLGPKFADLHPGQDDPRPRAFEPEHKSSTGGYLCPTYELGQHGGSCTGSCDYGSTAGQVLYAADDASDPGVDRVQTYAYEKAAICESPQTGGWLQGPHPEIDQWSAAVGRTVRLPNGFSQTEMNQTNGGILIFPDGLVGATGNQTAGGSRPHFQLPANKVPTSVAVTTYNEFALVTIWDTEAIKAQLAVFALRADQPEAFSVPYFALPNEAGFRSIHLMGYVDLPDIKTPTAIAASGNNGGTPGGHAIGNEFKNMASDPALRQAFARDDYERWVASSGQAVIASRWEDKITFVDLKPLFAFVRDAYFTTQDKWQAASAQNAWPYTFETSPAAMPVVVATLPISKPTALRIGNQVGAFPKGLQNNLNAFVANLAGEVRLFDVTAFSADARPVPAASIKETAKVQAGKNITSMTLSRTGAYNRRVLVASRGDRVIEWIDVEETALVVSRRLRDERISDPVVADANDRGPVVTVADFEGKKLVNFRVGPTEDNGGKPPPNYGCGPGGTDATCKDYECGGELGLKGSVYYLATTNVN